MRMLGRKFVPGFRVQVDDDEDELGIGDQPRHQPTEAAEVPEQAVLRVGQRAPNSDDGSSESDVESEASEEYESFTSKFFCE